MIKKIIPTITTLSMLLSLTVFFACPQLSQAEVVAVASPSASPETSPTPTPESTPSPTPEEPALSDTINQQVVDLKVSLKTLTEIKESIKTSQNIKNEIAIRQTALFKIIDISLNENIQTLNIISQIKDLDGSVLQDLKKMIESDNTWYQKFIVKINLATSPEQLKSMANEIRLHREETRGLTVRRLVGLILTLQELKAVNVAKERAEKIDNDLSNINSAVRPILGAALQKAKTEIESAEQLAKSSYLRLENMESLGDFQYARDWLERANESLKTAYSIFTDIAEKAK
jgi:ribosomal protein L7/L12